VSTAPKSRAAQHLPATAGISETRLRHSGRFQTLLMIFLMVFISAPLAPDPRPRTAAPAVAAFPCQALGPSPARHLFSTFLQMLEFLSFWIQF